MDPGSPSPPAGHPAWSPSRPNAGPDSPTAAGTAAEQGRFSKIVAMISVSSGAVGIRSACRGACSRFRLMAGHGCNSRLPGSSRNTVKQCPSGRRATEISGAGPRRNTSWGGIAGTPAYSADGIFAFARSAFAVVLQAFRQFILRGLRGFHTRSPASQSWWGVTRPI